MNYVVVVLDPVPEDLSAVIDVVAERFRIGQDKAVALLARAPGPVTKPVAEQQARTVAEILHQAGLRVELRAGDVDGLATSYPGVVGGEVRAEFAQPEAAAEPDANLRAGSEPLNGADADDEVVIDSGADAGMAAEVPVAVASRSAGSDANDEELARPEPGKTTTTPPRDPMKTTLTRNPPDLERNALRRRIATAATLPAVLTLLVVLLALAATLLPVLRSQQARRAADTAASVAATIEGLSGGLPLSAPLIRAELRQVEDRTRSQLSPRGVEFMSVIGGEDALLLEWNQAAAGPGSLTPEQSATALRLAGASGTASDADVDESLAQSLGASYRTLLAMVGLATEEPVIAAAKVLRGGVPAGTVVVGVNPAGLRSALGQVLLTTLLVGLIPVLFAVLAALSLTRGIRDAIRYLLVATDRISHGDFEQPVELRRDDELGQIASAVERMRVSLRESMERLRRRR